MLLLAHALTGLRVAFGATAIIAASDGRLWLAAACIVLGAAVDGLDGHLARAAGTDSPFGAMFDYFADYLCFVVAPWLLSRALLSYRPAAIDVLLALPLLTSAVRYARNGAVVAQRDRVAPDLPGLGTVFCAFVSVTAVFLQADVRMPPATLSWLLAISIVLLSVLMVVPVRYPKLTRFRGASPLVLVLLVVMPFVATEILAVVAIVAGVSFAVLAPLAAQRTSALE